MPTAPAKIAANRVNALKSTGPKTIAGKRKMAENPITHGIFSKRLILSDEDPQEYELLLVQLQAELAPRGVLEQSLAERIAVSVWRQKRLIRAESAYIELERSDEVVLRETQSQFPGQPLGVDGLYEFDQEERQMYLDVLDEFERIDFDSLPDISVLEEVAPLIYRSLVFDAETEGYNVEHFLKRYRNDKDYFRELKDHCQIRLHEAEQRPLVLEIVKLVRSKRAISKDKVRDSLSRYQVMLDNQLYRAIKELRDVQEWRLNSLVNFDGSALN